jgi:hypothetical protein
VKFESKPQINGDPQRLLILIGILIHCGPAFWPYFERLSNIQPQFSPTDWARDARANPFVVAGFKWPPILHGFG